MRRTRFAWEPMRRAAPSTILRKLEGGDRRSCGRTSEVVEEIRENPKLLADLVGGLTSEDPIVRMRAADALEKATRARPDWLTVFKNTLLRLATESEQQEVRWHLAQILPRLQSFLWPIVLGLHGKHDVPGTWTAGGPWA